MRLTRWLNQSLPQTLQIAVLLFYINAGFDVLFGAIFSPIGLVLTAGSVLAGLGIANEHKWGYKLAVAVSVLVLIPFVLILVRDGLGSLISFPVLFSLVFPVALFLLVIHPQSREYQKIWFD